MTVPNTKVTGWARSLLERAIETQSPVLPLSDCRLSYVTNTTRLAYSGAEGVEAAVSDARIACQGDVTKIISHAVVTAAGTTEPSITGGRYWGHIWRVSNSLTLWTRATRQILMTYTTADAITVLATPGKEIIELFVIAHVSQGGSARIQGVTVATMPNASMDNGTIAINGFTAGDVVSIESLTNRDLGLVA